MSTHTPLARRITAAAVLAAGVAVFATGCSAVHQQVGDAWSVTYEVRVDGPVGTDLSDVRVQGAEQRGGAPETARLGAETTTDADGDGSTWQHESIVLAEDRASVRATPPREGTATCRVLLDGKREIATETSSVPGGPVTCSVETPAFE